MEWYWLAELIGLPAIFALIAICAAPVMVDRARTAITSNESLRVSLAFARRFPVRELLFTIGALFFVISIFSELLQLVATSLELSSLAKRASLRGSQYGMSIGWGGMIWYWNQRAAKALKNDITTGASGGKAAKSNENM